MVMDQCRNGFLSFKITNMIPLLLIVLLRLGIVPNEVHHRLYHAHFWKKLEFIFEWVKTKTDQWL